MKIQLILPALGFLLSSFQAMAEPSNNRFANATTITGTFGQVSGTTVGATNEAGEPNQRGGGVWYKWTAPNSVGRVTVSAEIFGGRWFQNHWLDMFQDVNGSIFDVVNLGGISISNQSIQSGSEVVLANTTYYFRVAPPFTDSDRSTIQFTLNFSPIYRSGGQFSSRSSVLRGRRKSVSARISSPADVERVTVLSRGKGRARQVAYNRGSGLVRFMHVRKGGRPRGRKGLRRAKVTYTVLGTKAGQTSVQFARTFKVR